MAFHKNINYLWSSHQQIVHCPMEGKENKIRVVLTIKGNYVYITTTDNIIH